MTEKVIHEVRIIETDDGFRIEMKGDKDLLRHLIGRFSGEHRGGGLRRRMPWFLRRFRRWGPRPHHPPHPIHPMPPWPGEPVPPPGLHHHEPKHKHGHRPPPGPVMPPGYDLGPWWDEGDIASSDAPARI